MNLPLRKKLEDVCRACGVPEDIIIEFMQQEWIHPIDLEHAMFDEEDIARISLITELKEDLGVNDEAIPVILHLIDQLNFIHRKLKDFER